MPYASPTVSKNLVDHLFIVGNLVVNQLLTINQKIIVIL